LASVFKFIWWLAFVMTVVVLKFFTVRFQHLGLVTTFVYMNFWLYSLGWEYGDLYYKIRDFYCNVTILRLLFW
jgi:hypothetical protein